MMPTMGSVTNGNELNLRLDSTVENLPLWKIQMSAGHPVNELTKLFEREPLLPGVILTHNTSYHGMISRKKFFEHMSRPYSLELFSGRTIQHLYQFLKPEVFTLPGDILIVEATQRALQRSPQLVYEPIVVKNTSGRYQLLDFHQLLLANSQIHSLTVAQLQRVEEQSRVAKAGFQDLQHNYTRLLQNDKMAALGQLVAGIAHEINNPINFISGNLVHVKDYSQKILNIINLYRLHYPDPVVEIQTEAEEIELEFLTEDLPSLLNSMQIGCDRIEQIVRSLKNFSRLDEAEKKKVDIHEGIDSTLVILQSRLKRRKGSDSITLVKQYGDVPLVDCYPGLLNQVFMNILTNAIDALEESIVKGKKNHNPVIKICTQLVSNNWVEIRVIDNGTGIPENITKQLFDPFFTTKPVGKGTGLGLAISYQIIAERHGGQINCVSALGEGTEFIITVPVTQEE